MSVQAIFNYNIYVFRVKIEKLLILKLTSNNL